MRSFTSNSVLVAVEAASIPWFPVVDRRNPGRSCGVTVREKGFIPSRGIISWERGGGRRAVAMIPAVLAVVVAAL